MRSVSLYAHIPFCAQKCDYCDFFSVPKSGGIQDLYVESLLREASFYADSFGVDSWKTLYIGGGTPSLLSPRQLSSIVCGLGAMRPFSRDAEITVEMNPESVRAELIDACASSGVNRISLGIQALDERALSRVHRLGSPRMALDALSLLEKTWRGRLSVDFIAGLPGQTRDSFKNQFGTVFSFKNIDHISLYTLTIEDGTPLGKKIARGETDFSFDRADSMWILGRNILEKNGFLQMHYILNEKEKHKILNYNDFIINKQQYLFNKEMLKNIKENILSSYKDIFEQYFEYLNNKNILDKIYLLNFDNKLNYTLI